MKSKSKLTRAHDKAEDMFNLWVRMSNADINGNNICFTCDKIHHYKLMDAGHFIANRLDFHIYNKHPQCTACNRFKHGNYVEYTVRMIKMYGQEVVDDLRFQAHQTTKYTIADYEEIYELYKNKIKELDQS